MRRSVFLSVGLFELLLSYLLFSGQQYFSFGAMLGILFIVAIGLATVLLSYYWPEPGAGRDKRHAIILALLSVVALLLILYETGYDIAYTAIPSATAVALAISLVAVIILVAGLFVIATVIRRLENAGRVARASYAQYALVVVLLALLAALLYFMHAYVISITQWPGTDELAFNYYAGRLFLQGSNPYTANMQPILTQYGLNPTLRLNGTCECSYDYPALNFILLAALGLVGYPNGFVFGTVVLAVFVSYLLYSRAKFDIRALLPISVWFFAAVYITPASLDNYVAVSLFILLAYLYRSRAVASGVFLGLAASTNQLSWIALPFFYVLALRSHGVRAAAKSLFATFAVFIIANGYFIALSPAKTLGNIFELVFGKIQFGGPSLAQLFVRFFPTTYWAPSLIVVASLMVALALYYIYTDTLRPLIAIAPVALLFAFWRSLPSYTISFIPLMVAVYYLEKDHAKDSRHKRNIIWYSLAALAVFSIAMIVYAHGAYVNADTLHISHLVAYVGTNSTTGAHYVTSVLVNVTNNGKAPERVLFYIASRSPDTAKFTPVTTSNSLPTNSSGAYLLPVSIPSVNATTQLYVLVLSNDYMEGVVLNATGR